MSFYTILFALCSLAVLVGFLLIVINNSSEAVKGINHQSDQVTAIQKAVTSLNGRINRLSGKKAELDTILELADSYDYVCPLPSEGAVDFLCIKFGETVDFVEVKASSTAQLSKQQTAVRELVKEGKVRFIKKNAGEAT